MAQNESGQVQVVVIASPESDESQDMSGDQQPDMSREEKIAAAILWSMLEESEELLHDILVYQLLLYLGTCQAIS